MISQEAYGFHLPEKLIAKYPVTPPESSRLLRVRRSGDVEHHHCTDLPNLLPANSLLIANDTKVVKARLAGHRDSGGKLEVLLARPVEGTRWLALIRGGVKPQEIFELAGERVKFIDRDQFGLATIEFGDVDVPGLMDTFGCVPLPPYIDRSAEDHDESRYQTSFAEIAGAVAAPTAGLHFSDELRRQLENAGHTIKTVTLHVGPGTFLPVRVDDPIAHRVPAEWAEVSASLMAEVRSRHDRGLPVIAIGTTATRTLEAAVRRGEAKDFRGWVDLTMSPPFRFRAINGLMSNFHLPDSSLMLLVAAWVGRKKLLRAYQEAIDNGYRFYSYGDLTWFE